MNKILLASLIVLPFLLNAQSVTPIINTTTLINNSKSFCIGKAIDKRENSLISGHDVMNISTKNALESRRISLKEAWTEANKKIMLEKRALAYRNFKNNIQKAHFDMRVVRKSAWDVFEIDMRACGAKNHGEYLQKVSLPAFEL
jgi:hypothetical protein